MSISAVNKITELTPVAYEIPWGGTIDADNVWEWLEAMEINIGDLKPIFPKQTKPQGVQGETYVNLILVAGSRQDLNPRPFEAWISEDDHYKACEADYYEDRMALYGY
jgi:hypothetical protein